MTLLGLHAHPEAGGSLGSQPLSCGRALTDSPIQQEERQSRNGKDGHTKRAGVPQTDSQNNRGAKLLRVPWKNPGVLKTPTNSQNCLKDLFYKITIPQIHLRATKPECPESGT